MLENNQATRTLRAAFCIVLRKHNKMHQQGVG